MTRYLINRDVLLSRQIISTRGDILINIMLDLKAGKQIKPVEITDHFYKCRFDSWMTIDESTHVYVGNSTLVDIPKQLVKVEWYEDGTKSTLTKFGK